MFGYKWIYTCTYIHMYIRHLQMYYAIYIYIYKYTRTIYNYISYIFNLTKDFSSVCGNW